MVTLLGSHDREEITNTVNVRPEPSAEITASPNHVKTYPRERTTRFLAIPGFADILAGTIFQDEFCRSRANSLIPSD